MLGGTPKHFLTFGTPLSTGRASQVGYYLAGDRVPTALLCYPIEVIGGKQPRILENMEAFARVRGRYSGCRLAEVSVPVPDRLARLTVRSG